MFDLFIVPSSISINDNQMKLWTKFYRSTAISIFDDIHLLSFNFSSFPGEDVVEIAELVAVLVDDVEIEAGQLLCG